MNLDDEEGRSAAFSVALGAQDRTYKPPCQLPSPRMHSAWTLVMRRRFSVSEMLAES